MQIVIVEGYGVLRQGLRLLVGQEPDMVVIGEAADGEAAKRRKNSAAAISRFFN